MPNTVEIYTQGTTTVEVTSSPLSVNITETAHTVEVAALTRAVGNATLTGAIDVTNTIGDALAGGTYAAGTTLEAVVRDLISPFLEPAFASFSWAATGTHQANGEQLLVECGLAASVTGVTLTLTNPENLKNGSSISVTNTSTVPTAILGSSTNINPASLSNPLTVSTSYVVPIQTTPVASTVSAAATYLGNDGSGSDVSITRSTTIAARNRLYVITSTATNVSSISSLLSGAQATVLSTLIVDPSTAKQNLSVDCTASTANSSNFTYIIIAGAGTLGEVAAEVNGRGVADYTDSWVADNNSGSGFTHTVGTASPSYKVYRSIQPGAFDSDITLNIEILH
jgi:hypothetical protein